MRLAGLQLDIAWEDKKANFAKVRALVSTARLHGPTLLALPEMFATGFTMHVDAVAEPDGGDTEKFLSDLAKEQGISVIGGLVKQGSAGRGFNQSVSFGPDGALVARYSKIHPFSFGGETKHYDPGLEVLVHPWAEASVAPFVCYDLRFPEIFRNGVRKGAQIFTVIANWPEPREAHWLALLKARAIENQAFVLGVNRCGRDPKLPYSGRGQIIDPRGSVLADGGNAEGVFSAEIDLASLLSYRREFPALQDMKTGWI